MSGEQCEKQSLRFELRNEEREEMEGKEEWGVGVSKNEMGNSGNECCSFAGKKADETARGNYKISYNGFL